MNHINTFEKYENNMSIDEKIVKCGDCNLTLQEDSCVASEDRLPCPACGSLNRSFHVTIHDFGKGYEKIGMRGRHAEGGKPFIEKVTGADLHRKTGKWMTLKRTIDRDNNIYHEIIMNPETGEIIHECKEPLTQHVGHGAARQKEIKSMNIEFDWCGCTALDNKGKQEIERRIIEDYVSLCDRELKACHDGTIKVQLNIDGPLFALLVGNFMCSCGKKYCKFKGAIDVSNIIFERLN